MSTRSQVAPRTFRKSPLRKVGISGNGFGHVPKFGPVSADWLRLEQAIGIPLNQSHRDKIKLTVEEFLYWSTAAAAAPYTNDVEKEITKIRDAARNLRKILSGMTDDASSVARAKINQRLSQSPFIGGTRLDKIAHGVSDLQRCCNQELTSLAADEEGHDEHECWRKMVLSLMKYFSRFNIPATVSANQEKASKFVVFIDELQKILPNEALKKGQQSLVALAQEIKRARSEARDKKFDEQRTECPDGT